MTHDGPRARTVIGLTLLRGVLSVVATVFFSTAARPAWAGMPSPLPSDWETISRLTDSAQNRIQAISFFFVGLLVSALFVQLLWNGVRRDIPRLPRLRYGTALSAVILWGLMFVIVLTMISGARELMTPGAWVQQGWTYQLASTTDGRAADHGSPDARRARLDQIQIELLRFAAGHNGRFPDRLDAVAAELQDVPGFPGMHYIYVPGLSVDDAERILVYEPEVDHASRLVIFASGKTGEMTSDELSRALESRTR